MICLFHYHCSCVKEYVEGLRRFKEKFPTREEAVRFFSPFVLGDQEVQERYSRLFDAVYCEERKC